MSGKITITNQSPSVVVIDVEGIIGVPEEWQFEEPGQRIATYQTFRTVLERIKQVDAPEIIVNIRSTGGNVNDALLIFDALTALKSRITTRCFGYVASAATVIAQAASTGCREISANSLYLIHRSVCSAEGNSEELVQTLGLLAMTDERIAGIYAGRSQKPVDGFINLMAENNGNGRWLSPQEVVEHGLADRVIGGEPIADSAAAEVVNFGLPPIPKKSNIKNMNLTQRWNAILDMLGIEHGREQKEFVRSGSDSATIVETVCDNAAVARNAEVDELKSRIEHLEAQNARLAVKATATLPKEDPSVHDAKRSPNEMAYEEDIRRFNY